MRKKNYKKQKRKRRRLRKIRSIIKEEENNINNSEEEDNNNKSEEEELDNNNKSKDETEEEINSEEEENNNNREEEEVGDTSSREVDTGSDIILDVDSVTGEEPDRIFIVWTDGFQGEGIKYTITGRLYFELIDLWRAYYRGYSRRNLSWFGLGHFVHFFLHFHPQPEELKREPILGSHLRASEVDNNLTLERVFYDSDRRVSESANKVNVSPERIEQLIRELPFDIDDSSEVSLSESEIDSKDSSYVDSGGGSD